MPYSSASIIAILVTLIINNDILRNKNVIKGREEHHRLYRQYLESILIFYITDIVWGIADGLNYVHLAFIDTTVYFLAMACSVFLWIRFVVSYLKENKSGKFHMGFGWAFLCFTAVMLVVNLFKPVFFSIGPDGEYQTGIIRYIVIFLQIGLFTVTGLSTLVIAARSKGNVRYRNFTIGLSSLIMAGFIIAQVNNPLLPLYPVGAMLAGCLLHSFVLEREREELHEKLEQEQFERVKLENELESQASIAELMSSMSSLLTNMPAMTFSKDINTGEYLACNQAFSEYAGKKAPEEVVGKTDHDLFDKETADHFVEDDKKTAEMDEPNVFFEDVPDAAGTTIRNLQTTKQMFKDSVGRECLLGLCVDVTETAKKKAEQAANEVREQEIQKQNRMKESYKKHVEELSYSASHDELTGLYNRLGYNRMLKKIDLSECYFIMLDADDFKTVNDTYGHETGDKVLKKITAALTSHFRSGDYIFRVGGDEFVVIMTRAGEKIQGLVGTKIDRINKALADDSDGIPSVSISAGITHGDEGADDTELFRRADEAMYEAKKSGKGSYRFI